MKETITPVCSTPKGVTDRFIATNTRSGPGSRCAQRPRASLIDSFDPIGASLAMWFVLNAQGRH